MGNNHFFEQDVYDVCRSFCSSIAKGEKPVLPGKAFLPTDKIRLDPYKLATCIFDGACSAKNVESSMFLQVWPEVAEQVKMFLKYLENESSSDGLPSIVLSYLLRLALDSDRASNRLLFHQAYILNVDAFKPLADIYPPPGAQEIVCRIVDEEFHFGTVELPVIDGCVTAYVLKDSIANELSWPILGRFFYHKFPQSLVKLAKIEGITSRDAGEMHDAVGWQLFIDQLWGGNGKRSFTEKIRCGLLAIKQRFVRENMLEISDGFCTTKSRRNNLPTTLTAGGVVFGQLEMQPVDNVVTPLNWREAIETVYGFELCKVVVREALIGKPLAHGESLRLRLQQNLRLSRGLQQREIFVSPKNSVSGSNAVLGQRSGLPASSVGRRAALPLSTLPALRRMCAATGDVIILPNGVPTNFFYRPECTKQSGWHQQYNDQMPGSRTRRLLSGGSAFATNLSAGARRKEQLLPSEKEADSTVMLDNKGNEKSAAVDHLPALMFSSPYATDVPNLEGNRLPVEHTTELPILMYHRVATQPGAKTMGRYCVRPEQFEEQLAFFYRSGYYTVGLHEWLKAVLTKTPLPGRAIALTFDDGYLDFYTHAAPLLQKYNFTATVFLVTGLVGKTNKWDEGFGEVLPLMNLDQIRKLSSEGILFGSHTTTHASLVSLSPEETVYEAAMSRTWLAEHLEQFSPVIAYPFGHVNKAVAHLFGAVGYQAGLTCIDRVSKLQDNPLFLPRIEVRGELTLNDLAAKMETS